LQLRERAKVAVVAAATVLVGDDEAAIRTLIARVLEKRGYHVLPAADGLEAVALFREHVETISLVVLDVRMPNLPGSEALAQIRALRPSIPAILMSGFTADHNLADLLDRGVRFVPKPLRVSELADVVAELLSAPHA
jgi:CheY-like chemotaxis protein